jgi:hypothetical protein
MDKHTQKAIEDAGFRVTTVREFLDLTEAENELVELRVAISQAVRAKRESAGVTQSQLADRVHSSQPRIAKIEAAAPGVSLDLMFRSYFALGGKFADLSGNKRNAENGRRPTGRPTTVAKKRKASRADR